MWYLLNFIVPLYRTYPTAIIRLFTDSNDVLTARELSRKEQFVFWTVYEDVVKSIMLPFDKEDNILISDGLRFFGSIWVDRVLDVYLIDEDRYKRGGYIHAGRAYDLFESIVVNYNVKTPYTSVVEVVVSYFAMPRERRERYLNTARIADMVLAREGFIVYPTDTFLYESRKGNSPETNLMVSGIRLKDWE